MTDAWLRTLRGMLGWDGTLREWRANRRSRLKIEVRRCRRRMRAELSRIVTDE